MSGPHRDRRPWFVLLLVILVSTACGSRANLAERTRLSGTGEAAEGLSPEGGVGGVFGDGTQPGSPAAPGRAIAAGGAAAVGGSTGSAAGPGRGSTPMFGRGVTGTKILIGRVRFENAGEANRRLGGNVAAVPTDRYDKILVDYVNSTGGIGGRKIELVYYTVDAADPNSTTAGTSQRQCELWVRDRRVFAVLSGVSEQTQTCLHKANIANVYENVFSAADDAAYRRFPKTFEINAISLTRLGKVHVDGLFEQGYFGSRPAIGVVTWDGPEYRNTVTKVMKPALTSHGLRLHPDGEAYIKIPQSGAEYGDAAAAIQAAVLRFKAASINRVMFIGDSGAALVTFFTRSAQSQDYHPHYGLTSENGPQVVIDQGLVDPEQFRGARTVGWNPIGDLGNRPYTAHGPGYSSCIKLLESKGVRFGNDDNARVVALRTCDGFKFLRAAIEAGLPSITTETLVAGAESLGRRHPAALTYGTRFATNRHYGVGAVRYSAFREDCECFRYVGSLRPID